MNGKILAIVGATASGKTSLAIELAKKYNGEIICVDSRTIYRYMDIGTAKPTADEQDGILHWGLDLIDPDQNFSVADFQQYAKKAIDQIQRKNKLPILVGGSGLYMDAILFDFQFSQSRRENDMKQQDFENYSSQELINYCRNNNINLPSNYKNKRHLIKNIVQNNQSQPYNVDIVKNTIVVGLTTNKHKHEQNINKRNEQIIYNNVVKEATEIAVKFGWNNESMKGNVYAVVKKYINQEISQNEMLALLNASDRKLVKKQLTWFRRNPYVLWGNRQSIKQYLSELW